MPAISHVQPDLFTDVTRRLLMDRRVQLSLAGAGVFLLLGSISVRWVTQSQASLLQSIVLMLVAAPLIYSGLASLARTGRLTIELLMSISTIGAVIIGELPEALTLVVLYNLSEALETIITDNAQRNVADLMAHAPAKANLLRDGALHVIGAEELRPGDTVLVQPGENIPGDGLVIEGESPVDQAAITGESIPAWKAAGDEVYAGTINGAGALTVQVTRAAGDTMLQRIIHLVTAAQASRSPTQRFIDRFAAVYTPLVALLALLVATVPPLVFGQPFLNPEPGTQGWLFRALTILVIGCPCALVISTPITIISAIARAARRGVIIKGGAYLENINFARIFAFDKTGTLTRGQPRLTLARSIACENEIEPCPACLDLLETASALESRSKHPLAGAVIRAAKHYSLESTAKAASAVQVISGSGISGQVNGQSVVIGSHAYFDTHHPHSPDLCREVATHELAGQTVMMVGVDARVQGYLTAQDEIRPEAAAAIDALKEMGYRTVILSGDRQVVGDSIGKAVGADQVKADLLPEQKLDHIRQLKQEGPVIMVGDGMNDAPALAAADIGISMGRSGSYQAMETADIVLLADDLAALPFLARLSRFTNHLLRMNILISLGLKLAIFAVTLSGAGSMWLAVLADTGLTVLVALNGSRALRYADSAGS